jgi:hypothetical protein
LKGCDPEDHGSRPIPGKKVSETPSQLKKVLTVVACTCYSSNDRKFKIQGLQSRLASAKREALLPK